MFLTREHSTCQQLPGLADKRVRRGTTAMEYLFMLSLIVVVALAGIGYFGNATNNLTQASASAISNSMKKGS